MKIKLTLFVGITLITTSAFALDWTGNSFAALNVNGGGQTLYDLYNNGSGSGWDGGTTDFQGIAINITQGQSILLGAQVQGSQGDSHNGVFFYDVDAAINTTHGTFNATTLNSFFDPGGGNSGWETVGGVGTPEEIGSGLAAGTYVLSFYVSTTDPDGNGEYFNYRHSGTGDGVSSSTGGNTDNFNPFTATITVTAPAFAAPEPSSFALIALGMVLLNRSARRKKLS